MGEGHATRFPAPSPPPFKPYANFQRILVLPDWMTCWSLTTLREKVVKISVKVIAHARYTIFQMVEVAVPRDLFRDLLARIGDLRPQPMAPS